MNELVYSAEDFIDAAYKALESGDSIEIRIPSSVKRAVKKALQLHDTYFAARKTGKRNRILWAKFGWYAFRTPTLWAVLNKAELLKAKISTRDDAEDLIIMIKQA